MYKYKRGINNIDDARQVEYTLSDGVDTCLSMSACLGTKKPYNGLYIKNGKVIVENIIEKIEIKDKVYRIGELDTKFQDVSALDFITSIDLDENKITYDLGDIEYTKKIIFSKKYNLQCIEYNIKNKKDNVATFNVLPMITYRDLFTMKTGNLVNFNNRKLSNGIMINLSVMNDENVVLQSKDMKFIHEIKFLNGVKHEYNKDNDKVVYTEDLMLPGNFLVNINGNKEKNIKLFIASKEEDLEKINIKYIESELSASNSIITSEIDEKYVELRDLALAIDNLNFKDNLVPSLPYIKDYNKVIVEDKINKENINEIISDIEVFTDIIQSIDGQYLTFNKINKANKILIMLRRYIKNIDALKIEDDIFLKKFTLLKLWYVEIINKVLQKENNLLLYFDIVKDIVYEAINNKDKLLDEIKFVALFYNALKIYENMTVQKEIEDINIYEQITYIDNLINNKYWCESKRILKQSINDTEEVASIDMIYTISLSYPCLNGEFSIKLLDTIFKGLYTPYGLREYAKSSSYNNCLIYPKYMAHFVRANLRQNGITNASQKIAYNMVKELLQDINKYVNGGIKKVYHEKGIKIDSIGFDLLTNAEVIRLYDMLR